MKAGHACLAGAENPRGSGLVQGQTYCTNTFLEPCQTAACREGGLLAASFQLSTLLSPNTYLLTLPGWLEGGAACPTAPLLETDMCLTLPVFLQADGRWRACLG